MLYNNRLSLSPLISVLSDHHPLSQQWQHQLTTSVQSIPPSPLLTPTHPQLGPTLPQSVHHITPSPLVSILIMHNYINNIFSNNIISNITSSISNSYIIYKPGSLLHPYREVVLFPVLQVLEGDAEQRPSAWHPLRLLLPLT